MEAAQPVVFFVRLCYLGGAFRLAKVCAGSWRSLRNTGVIQRSSQAVPFVVSKGSFAQLVHKEVYVILYFPYLSVAAIVEAKQRSTILIVYEIKQRQKACRRRAVYILTKPANNREAAKTVPVGYIFTFRLLLCLLWC